MPSDDNDSSVIDELLQSEHSEMFHTDTANEVLDEFFDVKNYSVVYMCVHIDIFYIK